MSEGLLERVNKKRLLKNKHYLLNLRQQRELLSMGKIPHKA